MPSSSATRQLLSANEVRPCDVLLGRGRTTYIHPGNVLFRKAVKELSRDYERQNETDKEQATLAIVSLVKENGGRFLRSVVCPTKSNGPVQIWALCSWVEIRSKVKQALRDDVRHQRKKTKITSKRGSTSFQNRPANVASVDLSAGMMGLCDGLSTLCLITADNDTSNSEVLSTCLVDQTRQWMRHQWLLAASKRIWPLPLNSSPLASATTHLPATVLQHPQRPSMALAPSPPLELLAMDQQLAIASTVTELQEPEGAETTTTPLEPLPFIKLDEAQWRDYHHRVRMTPH